jgi:hypothetical protein
VVVKAKKIIQVVDLEAVVVGVFYRLAHMMVV